jgi:hypothetical protein
LLVKDYALEEARGRAVAERFIEEMAKRIAGDKALDLEGKQQADRPVSLANTTGHKSAG